MSGHVGPMPVETSMSMPVRVFMAALALFILWTMVRALRTGTIYSEGDGYGLDDRPVMFSLTFAVHAVGLAFFVWLAAGYDAPSFLRLLGLDAVVRWFAG